MARWADLGEGRHRMWSLQVLRRYWAMQLPGIVIVLLVASFLAPDLGWSHSVVWMAVAAWIVKDAILYLIVWRAYDPGYLVPFPYRMEGAVGVALHRIDRCGTVRVWGELWHAELVPSAPPIAPGQRIRVSAAQGMTLFVEALE